MNNCATKQEVFMGQANVRLCEYGTHKDVAKLNEILNHRRKT